MAIIGSEPYLLTCARNIELNPVRANMVAAPGQYRWSSYRFHAEGVPDKLVTAHALYLELGRTDFERQAAYCALCEQQFDDRSLADIRSASNHCAVLGSDRFTDELKAMTQRRLHPRPRGRPKMREGEEPRGLGLKCEGWV